MEDPAVSAALSKIGVRVAKVALNREPNTVTIRLTSCVSDSPLSRLREVARLPHEHEHRHYYRHLHHHASRGTILPSAPSPSSSATPTPALASSRDSYASDTALDVLPENVQASTRTAANTNTLAGNLSPYAQAQALTHATSDLSQHGPLRRGTTGTLLHPNTVPYFRGPAHSSPGSASQGANDRWGVSDHLPSLVPLSRNGAPGWSLTVPLGSIGGVGAEDQRLKTLASKSEKGTNGNTILMLKLVEDKDLEHPGESGRVPALFEPSRRTGLLDSADQYKYDRYKLCYAGLLYQWGMLEERAEVLKFIGNGTRVGSGHQHVGIGE